MKLLTGYFLVIIISFINFSPTGCTLWGSQQWTGKKKWIVRSLIWLFSPPVILLIALLLFPILTVVFPVVIGMEVCCCSYANLFFSVTKWDMSKNSMVEALLWTSTQFIVIIAYCFSILMILGCDYLWFDYHYNYTVCKCTWKI